MQNNLGYYISGNTAEGFVNLLSTNTTNFHHHIILKHPSHTLKTAIIKQIIKEIENEAELEVLYSPHGKEFLDGVIIRDKKIAIIDEGIATADLSGSFEINVSLFSAEELPENNAHSIIKTHTKNAYDNFETGLKIHDDLEEVYIKEMDFDRANALANGLIEKVLEDVPKLDQEASVVHRLFGTNTKDGVVNVVPQLLSGVGKKYFIKGRAGTGKSTFMKKVMSACTEYGYDVELYHCSFDPNSIDMVLVRALDFCIFDSTDPHEFFPEGPGEEIIDMYEEAVTPGTDEKYADEINELNTRYKSYMKKGIKDLKQAGDVLMQLEQQYIVETKEIDEVTSFILGKIVE